MRSPGWVGRGRGGQRGQRSSGVRASRLFDSRASYPSRKVPPKRKDGGVSERNVLDAKGVEEALDRLAAAIAARPHGEDLAVIGIRRRGVPLAERLAGRLAKLSPRVGSLDITLYRDDLSLIADQPVVHATEIDFPLDGLRVVLVDDVLFTGRTTRSAIDALFALGRPARIELAVLVDRGHRELPFAADYVGQTVETQRSERVEVSVTELDGSDGVKVTQ
ncbi:MAG TPA: bifunctional pyr operon transcriptional regulator/uracil phosphoribosyltransferase PyrR [Planctomycetes bacterium]|nr:bifunctional pyr operon transcriptional regulator/uracil phosphoribosyltransferase PyrR [Planctomycetota bacterium]